jgi:integral membrane sensor domain MASE1
MSLLSGNTPTAAAASAALCLAAAAIGSLTIVTAGPLPFAALWPPAGVVVAVLILADRDRWPLLTLAASGALLLSSAVLYGQPVLLAGTTTAVTAIDALLAASVVRRRSNDRRFTLTRLPHASALVIAAALVPMAGAAVGAVALSIGGAAPFFDAWRALWLGESLGVLVTAPVVIAVFSRPPGLRPPLRSWKALEIAMASSGTIAVAAGIFGDRLNPLFRVPAWFLPFLFWGVFRFGPGGAAAIMFVISVIGLWNAGQGLGPFGVAGAASTSLVLRSQGAIGIAAASFLLLATIVAERKRVAQEYALLVAELQQALTEINTLQGLIPICAWCHKVRDDAGFWLQIEEYLNHHTEATFSHGICPGCTRIAEKELAAHVRPGAAQL